MKTDRKTKVKKIPPDTLKPGGVPRADSKSNGKYREKKRNSLAKSGLRAGRQPFSATYDYLPIGIIECSTDGKYLNANREFCEFIGYEKEELLALGIKDITYEDDYSIDIKMHQKLVAGEIPFYKMEKRYVRKDGGLIWAEITRSPVRDTEGNLLYIIGAVLDVSDRKQREEYIRHLNAELQARLDEMNTLMEILPTGVWIGNHDCSVITGNPAAYQILGFMPGTNVSLANPSSDVPTGLKLFVNGEEVLPQNAPMQVVARSGKPWHNFEHELVFPDGTRKAVWGNVVPLFDRHGAVRKVIASYADFTERKRAEQALTEFARQQEALYKLADQLHRTNSFEGVFNAALDAILSGLLCDRASILLFDDTQVMRFVAWRGLSDEYRQATDGHSPWKPDEKDPEPICINDIGTAELSDSLKAVIEREGIGSLAFIPLVSNGRLIGKFMAYFNEPHVFQDGELDLSLTLAHQLAFGIDRKRAEEASRASEALYRTIARSIPGGGVYVVDKDFRYLVAEGPVTEAFGLSREMLEGRSVSEVFPDDRGVRMEERIKRNFAGEIVNFETKHNGRVYWTQQAPLRDSIGHAIIVTIDITERKQAEEALRQSEERFARFMQHLPGLAWIKDIQGRYVYANDTAEKAFNTPREKLYGRTDEEVFPPDVAAQFRKNDEQALMEGKGVQVIETLEHDDGVLHYSLVSKFPIPGPDGNIALIGGTAVDFTERKQIEDALRESEERFSAILRQATAGIVRKDAGGRLIFVNQAFCNMLGYTESELLGKTIWELTHAEDMEENKRLFERMMAEGIPFKLEKRLIRRDGSILWVDVSVSPLIGTAGRPQSAVAVEVDITGRKQAEEALQQLNLQLESRVERRTAQLQATNRALQQEIADRKQAEELLRNWAHIFEHADWGIATFHDETLMMVNPTYAKMHGYTAAELIGRPIQDVFAPETHLEFPEQLRIAYEKGHHVFESKHLRKDGSVFPVLIDTSVIKDQEGNILYQAANVRDITERKQAEQALRESRTRLQELSKRLVEVQEEERRAIARELHDSVGQSLSALNLNLVMIRDQLLPDSVERVGARLDDSMQLAKEAVGLVRNVMTDLRPAVLDDYGLEAAMNSYIDLFRSRYNIRVRFNHSETPLPRQSPSREMTLLRISQEALTNIARHARADQVNISLGLAENAIRLEVEDNGVGIPSSEQASRPGSHGLKIMRERAEAFDGTLRVESVSGKGTKVEASIPIENGDQAEIQKERRL